MPHRHWNIAIIGAGRVGQVFGRRLQEQGHTISSVVTKTTPSAKSAGRFLACSNAGTSVDLITPDTTLLLITTPHDAVASAAVELASGDRLRWESVTACHASGMLTVRALDPLAELGATVFSFHPLQTFPRDFAPKNLLGALSGIWYGVDGTDIAICRARALAKTLGGRVVVVPPAQPLSCPPE